MDKSNTGSWLEDKSFHGITQLVRTSWIRNVKQCLFKIESWSLTVRSKQTGLDIVGFGTVEPALDDYRLGRPKANEHRN